MDFTALPLCWGDDILRHPMFGGSWPDAVRWIEVRHQTITNQGQLYHKNEDLVSFEALVSFPTSMMSGQSVLQSTIYNQEVVSTVGCVVHSYVLEWSLRWRLGYHWFFAVDERFVLLTELFWEKWGTFITLQHFRYSMSGEYSIQLADGSFAVRGVNFRNLEYASMTTTRYSPVGLSTKIDIYSVPWFRWQCSHLKRSGAGAGSEKGHAMQLFSELSPRFQETKLSHEAIFLFLGDPHGQCRLRSEAGIASWILSRTLL